MYMGLKVIDVHGHMSAPQEFSMFGLNLINLRKPNVEHPNPLQQLKITDASLDAALKQHVKVLDERAIDVQLISPRPVNMWHWETSPIQQVWCEITNDLISRSCKLYPDRFIGVGQLPQNSKRDTRNCISELERCIKTLGFVGVIVNPDPGADGQTPAMDNEYWFPLYEKAQELGAVLMVHASITRDPRLDAVPNNYQVNNFIGQFLATLALEHGKVFENFPRLKVFVCHLGGALNRFLKTDPYHVYGNKDLRENLWFDTCAHDVDFLSAGIKQKGVHRVMFGTEAPGAGSWAKRPETGKPADDLLPVIDSLDFLSDEDKRDIFNRQAKRFFPLLSIDG